MGNCGIFLIMGNAGFISLTIRTLKALRLEHPTKKPKAQQPEYPEALNKPESKPSKAPKALGRPQT